MAIWIIGGGIALVIAAVVSMVLREHLPPLMPGLYLGIGGVCVIAAGVVYAWLWPDQIEVSPTPEQKAATKAQEEIKKQIEHVWRQAEKAFGPLSKDEPGRRANLIGIGRKEWNGNHEVPIVEVKGDRIWAGVVHLMSIDLAATSLAIRQIGLHLPTGTVYSEMTARYLLTDLLTATHIERKLISTNAWEQAAALAKEIGHLDTKANKTNEKVQADLISKKAQLGELSKSFEEPAGNTFVLSFNNGEKFELVIADCDHPNNKSDSGYPIGGRENLDAAVRMWGAINAAFVDAKDAHHTAFTGVKIGLDEYQKSVVDGLSAVKTQLASLESVMKEVLAVFNTGPILRPPAGSANGTLAQGTVPALASSSMAEAVLDSSFPERPS